jgi:hypothetical protein
MTEKHRIKSAVELKAVDVLRYLVRAIEDGKISGDSVDSFSVDMSVVPAEVSFVYRTPVDYVVLNITETKPEKIKQKEIKGLERR